MVESAKVRPMVLAEGSRTPEPIDLAMQGILARGERRVIEIAGPPGSGKSTALAYLRSLLPREGGWRFIDEHQHERLRQGVKKGEQVICTGPLWDVPRSQYASLSLVPWDDDQLIEYVLAADKARARAVLPHVLSLADRSRLLGNPEVWALVLETLLKGDRLLGADLDTILRDAIGDLLHAGPLRTAREACWHSLARGRPSPVEGDPRPRTVDRFIRHEPIRLLLATDYFINRLPVAGGAHLLCAKLPRDLINACAAAVRAHEGLLDCLHRAAARPPPGAHAMAASILHAAGVKWRLAGEGPAFLNHAELEGIRWAGIPLVGMCASLANFRRANLSGADLTGARMHGACLEGASLTRAVLTGAKLGGADLSRADMSSCVADRAELDRARLAGTNLEGASLRAASFNRATLAGARLVRADLSLTSLDAADLAGADLSGAHFDHACLARLALRACRLHGASFRGATLEKCDLQEISLPAGEFARALLTDCDLTGAFLENSNFCFAEFRGCGLAGIDLEGADLRNTDFRGSTFHMGSSRSGLVSSFIASEGSRTGFYTDELGEQDFRAPEDIRKANLRHADLRGAAVEGVDFYLVDLRDARYSAEQAEWFRKCGAILKHRCV
jgi:uncharacterized protein YjbI with pentapeptide repeats